jgi:hypothetical protein
MFITFLKQQATSEMEGKEELSDCRVCYKNGAVSSKEKWFIRTSEPTVRPFALRVL